MVSYKTEMCLIVRFFILIIIFLSFSFFYNRKQVIPSKKESIAISNFYGNLLYLKNEKSIILLQNYTVKNIEHISIGINTIDIVETISKKKGFCFNRSMLMQKAFLLNGIKVRPVILFANQIVSKTNLFDFFSNEVNTHNVFEFYWDNKWYMMETNRQMDKLQTLEQFLLTQKMFNNKPLYVRYLNNRNGRFISPSYLPDIYGF